jgi:hypothetical protein
VNAKDKGAFQNDRVVRKRVGASSIATSKAKLKINASERYRKTEDGEEGRIDEKRRCSKTYERKKGALRNKERNEVR